MAERGGGRVRLLHYAPALRPFYPTEITHLHRSGLGKVPIFNVACVLSLCRVRDGRVSNKGQKNLQRGSKTVEIKHERPPPPE